MSLRAEIGKHQLIRLLSLFRADLRARAPSLGLAGFVLVAQIAAELLVPWPLKVIVDNVIRGRPLEGFAKEALGPLAATPQALLWTMGAGMIVLALANGLLEYQVQAMLVRNGQSLILRIRQRVYGHLQRLSFAFHTRQAVGDLTARVTSDINSLQDLFISGLKNFATNGLLLVGMLTVLFVIDWRFTLAALAVVPALSWLILRFKPRVKRAARTAKRKEREMASLAQETLVSYRVVQAFGAEQFEDARFAERGAQAMAARVEAGVLQARFGPAVEVTLAAGTALVLGLAAHRAMAQQVSIGVLLVLLAYLKSMYAPLKQIAKAAGQLTGAAVSSELVVELLETEARIKDLPDARPAPRLKGAIEYRNVSFHYDRQRPALRGVSLCLPPGRHYVIVGATGAGKSTLVSLLPRFADPDEGQVLIDGMDVRSFTLRSLREQIAIVLQDAMLFRMTVRENIAYALPGATEQAVIAAAKAANAHEFIVRLPQQYDTLIDERGGNLSGGQRQRLTLARAFLRDAPILVLDEPTTGLDPASEALVLDALDRLSKGRTTLTIAHRLATIDRADMVIFLDEGQLVATGLHHDLLAQIPRYRQLCQTGLHGGTTDRPPLPVAG